MGNIRKYLFLFVLCRLGQYLDVHVDEDTFLYSESKIFTGPIYGCVFYGKENN